MRLLMVDYYGVCDEHGTPIGHSTKVLHEYAAMLQGEMEISAAASPCIANAVAADTGENGTSGPFASIHRLPYDIVETAGYGLGKRIVDKVRLFRNIHEAYRLARDYDVVWFYRTDFFLFLYAALHRRIPGTRMICLVYQQSFASGRLESILHWFYRRGLGRFDLVISTNPHITVEHPHVFTMPDYTYDPAEYAAYQNVPREDRVVCPSRHITPHQGTQNQHQEIPCCKKDAIFSHPCCLCSLCHPVMIAPGPSRSTASDCCMPSPG